MPNRFQGSPIEMAPPTPPPAPPARLPGVAACVPSLYPGDVRREIPSRMTWQRLAGQSGESIVASETWLWLLANLAAEIVEGHVQFPLHTNADGLATAWHERAMLLWNRLYATQLMTTSDASYIVAFARSMRDGHRTYPLYSDGNYR